MRVWETEANTNAAGLVLEQDLILRVRRMQRLATPFLVLNFVLNAVESLAGNAERLAGVQKQIQDFTALTQGVCAPMSNGDLFVIWDDHGAAGQHAARIVEAVLPGHGGDTGKFLRSYRMPADYMALRERANHYVEQVRAAQSVGEEVLDSASSRGPLTARSVEHIDRLLDEVNVRHYARTQPIYRRDADRWQAVGEEYFISFEDLKRERFPKLELASTEHFFFALCHLIDQRLLAMLTAQYDGIGGRPINLNLSLASIMGSVFAQFVHRIPADRRSLITFEIHRGDLLQDFGLTLDAIAMLKREGFHVALDGITPDMVGFIDLQAFGADLIKLNVSKDRARQLGEAAIRAALTRLPADCLVFYRCDNMAALEAGKELGVSLFQGWLIDDLAGHKPS